MFLSLWFLLSCCSGADLSGLLQLPQSCTTLSVGGAVFDDKAMSVIMQLTQLEVLCVHDSPGFTDAGLEQLTGLDLWRLFVYNSALSDAISQHGNGLLLEGGDHNLVGAEQPEVYSVYLAAACPVYCSSTVLLSVLACSVAVVSSGQG